MNKIHPFIWFVDQAEEAANFYVKVFPSAKIKSITRYPKSAEAIAGKKAGTVMTADIELNGTNFTFLNGGKVEGYSDPSNSVSFMIECDTQAEIDKYWEAFSKGGKPIQCGWIQDKFGVMWQVVPKRLGEMMTSSDKPAVERVTACYLNMVKFNIAELEKAYKGK